jgi:23S rRNA C2498 (ribose-2'-O)-methylase RlmM
MSTQQDILDQLVQDIMFSQHILATQQMNLSEAEKQLEEWGYTWSWETGLVKLPEGEMQS